MASPDLSRPYASAAAVGSLITRRTFNPAIEPASYKSAKNWLELYLCCLTLTIVEVSGDGDDSILDTLTEKTFGGLLHLCKNEPTDLRRGELLITSLYPSIAIGVLHDLERNLLDILLHFGIRELSPDETLSSEQSVLRVHDGLAFGWNTN